MKFKTALWLSLLIFTVHNIEEYFTMSNFYREYIQLIPSFAARFAKPMTDDLFIMMIVLITVIYIGLIVAGIIGGPNSPGMFCAITMVMGGLFVNGFHHLAITLYFGAYTPGVITSVLLFIPYSIYLLRKAMIERQIMIKPLVGTFIAGTVLLAPTILVLRPLATFLLSL